MLDLEHTKLEEEEHQSTIIRQCNDSLKKLEDDIDYCRTQQDDIRSEIQACNVSSIKSANTIRDLFSRIHSRVHLEHCCNKDLQNKAITNLKEQIAILKTEKDSALQMVEMLLKNITALEQKLETKQIDSYQVKLHEEQLEIVKRSYSDVIKLLENKLFKVKSDFAKQQSLSMKNDDTIEKLKREKQEMENNLQDLQQTIQQKDKNNQRIVQSLTEELSAAKAEIQRLNHLNSNSEKKLNENKKIVNNVIAKNEETKCKLAEALDLIEYAIKEKEVVLEREAKLAEQNTKLEGQLASGAKEHAIKMQEEVAKLTDIHEHDMKKYLLEIKELKSELREKVMLLDRSQRENRLIEAEMENERQSTADLLEKSASKMLERIFDQTPKLADFKTCNETCKLLYNSEIQQLQKKIANLEENLTISNNHLKQSQQQNSINSMNVDCIKLAEERTKDAIDRYIYLESQLIKATNDKESLTTKLKSLQLDFDCEIRKRDHERCMLENKIRELEMDLRKKKCTRENKSGTNISPLQVSSQHCEDTVNKHTLDIRIKTVEDQWQSILDEKIKVQQERFDKKMQEMKNQVTIYQDLNKNWADESKFMTEKFQEKLNEQHRLICILRNKNTALGNKLLLVNDKNVFKNAMHMCRWKRCETR
ncbi:putative leucine-rich repeat-containing protein DDB_G0290503 isoform X1 [Polyergus mexicanus]|uniref:putative leucine-rich repeat-containing protein DDB_G0290503 isoform X1 n=1 Tax=Polyergus mexicanus TaxID=615972 RepID=UPI0038B61080